jgi:predicted patatin/cPLA2 family phospholipase
MSQLMFSKSKVSNNSYRRIYTGQETRKFALVVEGGGMRTIFAAGVLDSFHENNFDPFTLYLGVSAGSMSLASHLAGQYLRNYRVFMHCATSGAFISSLNYLRGGHYINLDWLTTKCLKKHPLDTLATMKNLADNGKKFIVVCTNTETGQPDYLYPNANNIFNILTGSCCVPLLYRDPVYLAGIRVIDGGIGDPIPVKKAYLEGATDIVIIRSRIRSYRETKDSFEKKLGCFLYRHLPKLQQSILNLASTYNEGIAFIDNPPPGVTTFQIAPQQQLKSSMTTTNIKTLEHDYLLGKNLGNKFIMDWQTLDLGKKSNEMVKLRSNDYANNGIN